MHLETGLMRHPTSESDVVTIWLLTLHVAPGNKCSQMRMHEHLIQGPCLVHRQRKGHRNRKNIECDVAVNNKSKLASRSTNASYAFIVLDKWTATKIPNKWPGVCTLYVTIGAAGAYAAPLDCWSTTAVYPAGPRYGTAEIYRRERSRLVVMAWRTWLSQGKYVIHRGKARLSVGVWEAMRVA